MSTSKPFLRFQPNRCIYTHFSNSLSASLIEVNTPSAIRRRSSSWPCRARLCTFSHKRFLGAGTQMTLVLTFATLWANSSSLTDPP
jgi:hypothetical protein